MGTQQDSNWAGRPSFVPSPQCSISGTSSSWQHKRSKVENFHRADLTNHVSLSWSTSCWASSSYSLVSFFTFRIKSTASPRQRTKRSIDKSCPRRHDGMPFGNDLCDPSKGAADGWRACDNSFLFLLLLDPPSIWEMHYHLLMDPTLQRAFLAWGSVNTFIYVRFSVLMLSFSNLLLDWELVYIYSVLVAAAIIYALSGQDIRVCLRAGSTCIVATLLSTSGLVSISWFPRKKAQQKEIHHLERIFWSLLQHSAPTLSIRNSQRRWVKAWNDLIPSNAPPALHPFKSRSSETIEPRDKVRLVCTEAKEGQTSCTNTYLHCWLEYSSWLLDCRRRQAVRQRGQRWWGVKYDKYCCCFSPLKGNSAFILLSHWLCLSQFMAIYCASIVHLLLADWWYFNYKESDFSILANYTRS